MGLLFLIAIVLLVYLLVKGDKGSQWQGGGMVEDTRLEARNAEWAGFIAGYYKVVKTKVEKKLIERMLGDIAKQGLPVPLVGDMEADALQPQLSANSKLIAADRAAAAGVSQPAFIDEPMPYFQPERTSAQIQMDNASMLLYFGAFLFVASVGLFVAFGGLPGTLRTFAVALVALVMYTGGLWLFKNRAKLEQAGLAFAGIGLATAPFVGLAAYNFVFDQSSGSLVWFMTSLGCMGLYLHALFTLRKPLLNYILIFTFLSLIESGVSIIDAPLYYFGWGFAAVGLLLSVLSRYGIFDDEFRESSHLTARVLMPLASAASVLMVGSQGVGQLGVSLLLAAAYYAIEFMYGEGQERVEDAVAAQVTGLGAAAALTYAVIPEFAAVAGCLLILNGLQILVLIMRSANSELWQNFASITAVSSIAAVCLSASEPKVLVLSLLALVANSVSIWRHQDRTEAYGLAVIAWMALPLAVGQLLLNPHLSVSQQSWLLLAALLVQWAVLVGRHHQQDLVWQESAKVLYILSAAGVLLISFLASPPVFLALSIVVAASMALLSDHDHDAEWASLAGVVVSLPVLRTISEGDWFAWSIGVALVANIVIALRYRQELTRWLGTGLWLLLPVSLGNGTLGYWTPAEFAWTYMIAMTGLIFARAIARGVVFVSGKVPLKSYAQTASLSYVTGYIFAAGVAVWLSLLSESSQLHTTIIFAMLCVVTWLLASKIEKRMDLFVLLPILAQSLLLSLMRPDVSESLFDVYLVISLALAVFSYIVTLDQPGFSKRLRAAMTAARDGALLTVTITPLSFMAAGETHLIMPIGLLALAGLLYHRMRETGQANREWIGGMGLVGIWWLMWYFGVRNAQAYTHVLAALFAAYAYWRHVRSESGASDQYLMAMLGTATVPLALQALGGTAGDLYGWWLLLEQVFFMLLGMSIGKSFVTRWGLYVAVGAVLYQLRNLGWAALTVLAMFLIGLAVYRLQNQDNDKQ